MGEIIGQISIWHQGLVELASLGPVLLNISCEFRFSTENQIRNHLFLVKTASFLTSRFLSSIQTERPLMTAGLRGISNAGAKPGPVTSTSPSAVTGPTITRKHRNDLALASMFEAPWASPTSLGTRVST